ncbi:ATP-binding cassette domain-containing protein [Anaerobiospirillum succiniciproducens]|uniref:ATP-binding cassette domain-containing protein n=1 Tax=Anaerobiospirillum succiniciproducens TaxID=13335 RepID=UPI00040C30D6|nr:ATP-binding cassette domain-containing protein [Anaerobiospirillum succiniciproducens]
MLKIEGLKVVRGDFTVSLPEITIADGECVALCGVSGSGKSTLMEAIALITPPLEVGSFIIDRIAVDELSAKEQQALRVSSIGIMPQTGGLLPYLTIRENFELQIRMALRQATTEVFDRQVSNETTIKSKPSAIDSASASSLNKVALNDKSAISIDGFAAKARSLSFSDNNSAASETQLKDEDRMRVRLAAAQLSVSADSYDSHAAGQFTPHDKRKLSAESLVHAELSPKESTANRITITNKENQAMVDEMMAVLMPHVKSIGLYNHLDKLPEQLSIGQRQRALFLRAIAHKPRLLLIDEPTSALDPDNAANLFQIIDEIAKESGISILLITHDLKAAARYTRYVYDSVRSHSEYSVFTFYDNANTADHSINAMYTGRPVDFPSAPHIYSSQFAGRSINTFHNTYSKAGSHSMASSGVTLSPMPSSSMHRVGGFSDAIKTEAGGNELMSSDTAGIEILYDELGHLYSAKGRITYYTTPANKLKGQHNDGVDDNSLTSSKRGGPRVDDSDLDSSSSAQMSTISVGSDGLISEVGTGKLSLPDAAQEHDAVQQQDAANADASADASGVGSADANAGKSGVGSAGGASADANDGAFEKERK